MLFRQSKNTSRLTVAQTFFPEAYRDDTGTFAGRVSGSRGNRTRRSEFELSLYTASR